MTARGPSTMILPLVLTTQPKNVMKRLFCSAVLVVLMGSLMTLPAKAQPIDGESYEAEGLTSQRRPLRVTARPLYQYFENDGTAIAEWSLPVQATIPLMERLQLNVRGSVAAVSGDALEDLSGLGDVQASLSYAREVGEGSLILSAGANHPVGTRELTLDEFRTAACSVRTIMLSKYQPLGKASTWPQGLRGQFQ